MSTPIKVIPDSELVLVNIQKVILFRSFDPLSYLLFGAGQQLFLAHLLTKPPDFDQVLSVKVVGHQFTDEELRNGVRVFFPDRANFMSEEKGQGQLKEGERVKGQFQMLGANAAGMLELELEVGMEFYFETGDLARPM